MTSGHRDGACANGELERSCVERNLTHRLGREDDQNQPHWRGDHRREQQSTTHGASSAACHDIVVALAAAVR
jgi:hypothetical protein